MLNVYVETTKIFLIFILFLKFLFLGATLRIDYISVHFPLLAFFIHVLKTAIICHSFSIKTFRVTGNYLGGSWLHILKFISQLLSTPLLAESRNSSRSSSPVPPAQQVGTVSAGSSSWTAWAGSLRESLEKKLWDPTAKALHRKFLLNNHKNW